MPFADKNSGSERPGARALPLESLTQRWNDYLAFSLASKCFVQGFQSGKGIGYLA